MKIGGKMSAKNFIRGDGWDFLQDCSFLGTERRRNKNREKANVQLIFDLT